MQTFLYAQIMQEQHNVEFSPECLNLLLDSNIDLQIKEEILNEMLKCDCQNLAKWLYKNQQLLIPVFKDTSQEALFNKVAKKFLKGQ